MNMISAIFLKVGPRMLEMDQRRASCQDASAVFVIADASASRMDIEDGQNFLRSKWGQIGPKYMKPH